jgi:hypothetical protein
MVCKKQYRKYNGIEIENETRIESHRWIRALLVYIFFLKLINIP